MQDAVTILAIDEDENVILVEQFRIGADKACWNYQPEKWKRGKTPGSSRGTARRNRP
jgi:hypothetical protein